jgi:uncharacterized protein (TIRG00374 family)
VPTAPLAPQPNPPPVGFLRRHRAKLVASFIITVGLVYSLQKGGLKVWPDGVSFSYVKWWVVPLYVVTFLVTTYFRSVRWRFLLRSVAEVSRARVLAVSCIGFAAIIVMPFRLGEFVRPYMIRERGKVSMTAATGTVVAERVIDGLFLSIVLAVALVLVPTRTPMDSTVMGLPVTIQQVRFAGFMMLAIFTVASAVIAVFYVARDWARRITLNVVGVVSKKLAVKLADTAEKFAGGLHFLGRARDAVPFMMETTVYWVFNAFGMWLLAWGCGIVHADGTILNYGETCAIMGMLGVTILVPGPPGLLGVFQAGIYMGMAMYLPRELIVGRGDAFVFLLYALQMVATLLLGVYFFVTGGPRTRRQFEEAEGMVPPTDDGADPAPTDERWADAS